MKKNSNKNKSPADLKFLGLGFFFVFIGYSGIQRYVAPFFSELGMHEVGFESLLLIYISFIIASPFAGIFISKHGAKHAIILAAVLYSLFIVSLASGSLAILYISSILLGIAAAFIWNGHSIYALRKSDSKKYGRTLGFLETFKAIGSALSPMLVGLIVVQFSFKIAFLFFALTPLIGILFFARMSEIPAKNPSTFLEFLKTMKGITLLRISAFWFSMNFVLGLSIGAIPLSINNEFGLIYVGIIQSLVYLSSISLFYIAGRFSDRIGRAKAITIFYIILSLALISLYISGKIFILIGVILATLAVTIGRPSASGLIGDIAPKKHLETVSSFLWFMQNLGAVSALAISRIFNKDLDLIYLTSLVVIIISAINVIPILMRGLNLVKKKVNNELERI